MKRSIFIIGGGPASLALASFLDPAKFNITIYEKNKSMGRKFLVAGNGGFNLTHSESIEQMIQRYSPQGFLDDSLNYFDNVDLRNWLLEMNIPTYIGSSKRVYPEKGIKPIEVLNALLKRINQNQVEIKFDYKWNGWSESGDLVFENQETGSADFTVFALGGGSWKVTGSDGNWLDSFARRGIEVVNFQPSNCSYEVNWSSEVIDKFAGAPLKNIALSCGDLSQKGELVLTEFGLEGNAIYALSPEIRKELNCDGKAIVYLDIKPTLSEEQVYAKLISSTFKNTGEKIRKSLKLSPVQYTLLKLHTSKETYTDNALLAKAIKNLRIELVGVAELDEAISTVGGVSLAAISNQFELQSLSNHFCIGEMLDWDAPTGGYLLQACFSMGAKLAFILNER